MAVIELVFTRSGGPLPDKPILTIALSEGARVELPLIVSK
jgi:hypothetical protein